MTKPGMRIRPIRNEEDHRRAVARIEALISATPNTPEGDELEIVATLVDAYEARHFVMDAPSPIAAIRFRMEQEQLSRKDLEPLIGSRARVSEVLTGKRPLTLNMVRRLRGDLGISADLLITPLAGKLAAKSTSRSKRPKSTSKALTKRSGKAKQTMAAKA